MSKVLAICRQKALILTIPMYCVKKSNLGKFVKYALFVVYDVTTIYLLLIPNRVDVP